MARILAQGLGIQQTGKNILQPGAGLGQIPQGTHGLGQQGLRADLSLGHQVTGPARRLQQGPGVAGQGDLFPQGGFLRGIQAGFLQLPQLVFPHFQLLAGEILFPAPAFQFLAQVAIFLKDRGESGLFPAQAQHLVQKIPGETAPGQFPLLILALHGQQTRAQLLQQGQRRDQTVDQHPPATLPPQFPSQHQQQIIGQADALLTHMGRQQVLPGQVKNTLHVGQILAQADVLTLPLATGQQAQGAGHQALAGPGFAGDDGQTPAQGQDQIVHQGQVAHRAARVTCYRPLPRRRLGPPQFSLWRMTR